MSRFNYAKEKAKFDREWSILEKQYREAGMSDEAIEQMREYDISVFNRRRSWATYETPFSEVLPDESTAPDLNIESLTIGEKILAEDVYHVLTIDVRLNWINELPDSDLVERLLQLSKSDLVILSAYVFEGMKQKEIGENLGFTQSDISQKLTRIKKILKNFYAVL